MLRIPTGPGGRAPVRPRLPTLAGLAVAAVLLPLGTASGQPGGPDRSGGGTAVAGASGGRTAVAGAPASGAGAAGGSGAGVSVRGVPATGAPVVGVPVGSPSAGRTPAAVPPAPEAGVAGRERRRTLGLGQATAVRCGPGLSAPDGVEAQTCVLTRGGETWARTYYRNTSGDAMDALLSLMGPGGRTVLTRCAADGDDEPATCETPRVRVRGAGGVPGAFTAVAEFAGRGDAAPLLLRAGSNFPR
ncbi:hypothetical protein [Streptomyces sp. NPDC005435]|uniref:hypothetical protein n=1 Tax=Streptomyces sp. NPDC005435 TaxID=3154464 RepID=UPI0034554AF4